MGVEKARYDALATLFAGDAANQSHFGPLPPNGSANQRALGIACWYRHKPDQTFTLHDQNTTVRQWALDFYAGQVRSGMWKDEPNSSEYHHLHGAAGWALYDAAVRSQDEALAAVMLRWVRNDLTAAILFAVPQANTVQVAAPSARCARPQSLSRNIQLQQELGFPVERAPGHKWWDFRERRESLGATVHAARKPLLTPEEQQAARAWIQKRELHPAFEGLLAQLRYADPILVIDSAQGWQAFFPLLRDCWDNAQPGVVADAQGARLLRARSDDTGEHFWHKGNPVTCRLEGGRLVAEGQGHRGDPGAPVTLWTRETAAAPGAVRRTIEIGPTGVKVDGRQLPTSEPALPPDLTRPPLLGPNTAAVHADLNREIGLRKQKEVEESWSEVRQIIERQRVLLDTLRRELGL